MLDHDRSLTADRRPPLTIIADKDDVSRDWTSTSPNARVGLLRPSYRNRTPHPGEHLLKPVRQLVESIFDTLKGQLDLKTPASTASAPGSGNACSR
jgi:hypothetical protein